MTTCTTVNLESKKSLNYSLFWQVLQFFLKSKSVFFPSLLFPFGCNDSRPDSDADTISAELRRGWSLQGDRGRISSSTRGGKQEAGKSDKFFYYHIILFHLK